jgi:hypothetical protein
MEFSEARKALSYLTIAILLCVLSVAGCVGATRLPARSRGPAGETFQKKELDLTFLDQSGIQREEVRRRLAAIDTAYANPRLFWGRWSDSKWGYWWFIAAQTGAAGDAKRVWHVHNVLVTFDEEGVMQKKMQIDDERDLWRELHVQLTNAAPLDLSQPMALSVAQSVWLTSMTLTTDSVQITRRKRKAAVVEISPLNIVRISHSGVQDKGSSVGITCHTLHLSEKSLMGKRVPFCTNAPTIASIFQYLSQYGRRDMLWE